MLSEGGQKVKELRLGGGWWWEGGLTKAAHCSSSPTLEVVVQGLASLGLG